MDTPTATVYCAGMHRDAPGCTGMHRALARCDQLAGTSEHRRDHVVPALREVVELGMSRRQFWMLSFYGGSGGPVGSSVPVLF